MERQLQVTNQAANSRFGEHCEVTEVDAAMTGERIRQNVAIGGGEGAQQAMGSSGQTSKCAAAVLDSIAAPDSAFGGDSIETGTDSYRLASTRARAEAPANLALSRGGLSEA